MNTILRASGARTLLWLLAASIPAVAFAADEPVKKKPAQAYSVYHDDGDSTSYDDPTRTHLLPTLILFPGIC